MVNEKILSELCRYDKRARFKQDTIGKQRPKCCCIYKKRVEIPVAMYNSKLVALVGHHDCAEKPVDKKDSTRTDNYCNRTLGSWDFDVKVVGLWVDENVEYAIYAGNWAMLRSQIYQGHFRNSE